ncbi:MAG TPA: hypothetical protein DEB31_10390, partial [Clostridiales bacterium]|nr:hypothetical protein [Clostridiales bacterium]
MYTAKNGFRKTKKQKRPGLIIAIIIACASVAVYGAFLIGCSNQPEQNTVPTPSLSATPVVTTFAQGVSVGGVDVSGMDMEQARQALEPVVLQAEESLVTFTLPETLVKEQNNVDAGKEPSATERSGMELTSAGAPEEPEQESEEIAPEEQTAPLSETPEEYSLTAGELGVSVDIEPALASAMEYSQKQAEASQQTFSSAPQDFPVERTWSETAISEKLGEMERQYGWKIDPQGVGYEVRTTSDEESLTTGGEMVKSDPHDGYEIDMDALVATVAGQIESGAYAPFTAEGKTISAAADAEPVPDIQLMGTFTTQFKDSKEGRLYNIWKISESLNGVVFKPGEEFSVNNHVGPRNEENGWAIALGIENGEYTPQYGGGICQVSSTMYNAALLAELRPTARRPHTIMAKYTPPGQDATISTNGPDLKVVNDFPRNLYMIVKCDVPGREVTVEIWGTVERDYTVEISSELISKSPITKVEYVTDPSLEPFAYTPVHKGQEGEYYEIFRKKIYSDGREEMEKISSSTYPAKGAAYVLGPGIPLPAPGTPFEQVKAQADQLKAEADAAA